VKLTTGTTNFTTNYVYGSGEPTLDVKVYNYGKPHYLEAFNMQICLFKVADFAKKGQFSLCGLN